MAKRKDIPAQTPGTSTFQRPRICVNSYANNVRYEQTMHDVTLVFGQSDMSTGTEIVKQNIAVTVPWSVANSRFIIWTSILSSFELYNGKIPIPA